MGLDQDLKVSNLDRDQLLSAGGCFSLCFDFFCNRGDGDGFCILDLLSVRRSSWIAQLKSQIVAERTRRYSSESIGPAVDLECHISLDTVSDTAFWSIL
jgi:hypothetical protein